MLRFVVVLGALAVLAAGCGVRNDKPFTAGATAPCLEGKEFTGVTTSPKSFIAATAENGGLQAKSPSGNLLTIAFAADEDGAASTESAFRRLAQGIYKKQIDTVMSSNRNAVLVWTTTPSSEDSDTVRFCLKS